MKGERFQMSGDFIETYYMDRFSEEVTFEDPREPEIVVPDVIEEELYIVEPVLEDETLDDIQPDVEYNQPITTTDPLLNDSYWFFHIPVGNHLLPYPLPNRYGFFTFPV